MQRIVFVFLGIGLVLLVGPGPLCARSSRPTPAPPRARPWRPLVGKIADLLPVAPGVIRLKKSDVAGLPLVSVPVAEVVAWARKHCRTSWVGIYKQRKKVGYGMERCWFTQHGGKPVLATGTVWVQWEDQWAGAVQTFYALEGNGPSVYYWKTEWSGGQETTVELRATPTGWQRRAGTAWRQAPDTNLPIPLGTSELAALVRLHRPETPNGTRIAFWHYGVSEGRITRWGLQVLARTRAMKRGGRGPLLHIEEIGPWVSRAMDKLYGDAGTMLLGDHPDYMKRQEPEHVARESIPLNWKWTAYYYERFRTVSSHGRAAPPPPTTRLALVRWLRTRGQQVTLDGLGALRRLHWKQPTVTATDRLRLRAVMSLKELVLPAATPEAAVQQLRSALPGCTVRRAPPPRPSPMPPPSPTAASSTSWWPFALGGAGLLLLALLVALGLYLRRRRRQQRSPDTQW